MGMYSSFDYEDIEVKDLIGLKSFFKEWKIANPDYWCKESDMFKDNEFTFQFWDNIKLISYWYSDDVAFLSCVAKYIEGNVDWDFEDSSESGNVRFENGKCIFTTGVMIYNEWEISESDMRDLNDKTKRLVTYSKI